MPELKRKRKRKYAIRRFDADGKPRWWNLTIRKSLSRRLLVEALYAADCPVPARIVCDLVAAEYTQFKSLSLRVQLQWLYNNGYSDRHWLGRDCYYELTPEGKELCRGNTRRSRFEMEEKPSRGDSDDS